MRLARLLVTALLVLPARLVLAADDPADTSAAPADTAEATEAGATTAAEPAAVSAPPAEAMKGPFPRISDDEETIYAVQRKAFLVNQKIEITPMGAASFTDRFVQSFGAAGSLTYHIAENLGLSAMGIVMFPSESGLTGEILEKYKLTPEIAKHTQLLWGAGIGVQLSPIYGKLEIFGASLGNFNFYVEAGAGLGQTRVQCTPGLELDPEVFGRKDDGTPVTCRMIETSAGENAFQVVYEPNRTTFMAALGGGVRFYFSNSVGLKFEVKDWVFPARVFRPGTNEPTQRFTDAIRNNVFVQLGVSFLFGGEKN